MAQNANISRQTGTLLWLITIGGLLLGFAAPVLFVHLNAPDPVTRRIHIETFRYGMQPEIIHVNRGDTLILTFSARDTAQSFFLQEYDIDAKITTHAAQVEVVHPSDPEGEPQLTREVVLQAGRPGFMGFFNTKCRFRNHVYSGELHGFEQGFLVIHPNYLHAGATGVLVMIPLIGLIRWRWRRPHTGRGDIEPNRSVGEPASALAVPLALYEPGKPGHRPGTDLLRKWPFLKALLKSPSLQIWIQTILSVLTYVVILLTLVGTTMAGGNLGILLVWVIWMTLLIVIFVPLGGRIWCTVCPLPLIGDVLQRGATPTVHENGKGRYNTVFRGLMLRWPAALSNAIPRTVVFLGFGTVSILLLSQPRWTAWAIILLLAAGTIMPLIFELRTFCRWLCPINSFISLYALMAPLSLRPRKAIVCEKCKARGSETCREGNEHGFACPYGLSASEVDRNNECGLCMECIRSCTFENVALRWRPFGLDRVLGGRDEAWQAIVMLTLAVVYLITFQGPWHSLRDMVNVVDKNNWDLFAVYSASLWLLALGFVPLVIYVLALIGRALSGARAPARTLFIGNATALVPIGLLIWIAFAIPMVLIDGSFFVSTLSDPFGWGWDLFGTAGQPWWQLMPEVIPWLQAALVLIGLTLSLRTARRVWSAAVGDGGRTLSGMLPMASLLLALTFGLIWFFTG